MIIRDTNIISELLRPTILPFDSLAAEACAAIATRNAKDFEGCGIKETGRKEGEIGPRAGRAVAGRSRQSL